MFIQRFNRHNVFFRSPLAQPVGNNTVRRLLKGAEYGLGFCPLLANVRQSIGHCILHAQWTVVPTIDRWFWRRVKELGVPIVYTAHNVLPHDFREKDVPFYRWLYEHADRVIVHSPANRDNIIERFPETQNRVRVVPFGEFSTFLNVFPPIAPDEARSRLGLQAQDQVVLFFGNIAPYKGLGILIEAMGKLADELPALRLVIAGKCTHGNVADYQQQIQQTGLADRLVLYLKHVPTDENRLYFAACDVCVLPYISASQSMTLFMSFANQKPVVVTRTGGLADTVEEGKSGLIVPPGSVDALAAALKRFFALPLADRVAMGVHGKQRIDVEGNWQSIARKTEIIYRELIPPMVTDM